MGKSRKRTQSVKNLNVWRQNHRIEETDFRWPKRKCGPNNAKRFGKVQGRRSNLNGLRLGWEEQGGKTDS